MTKNTPSTEAVLRLYEASIDAAFKAKVIQLFDVLYSGLVATAEHLRTDAVARFETGVIIAVQTRQRALAAAVEESIVDAIN